MKLKAETINSVKVAQDSFSELAAIRRRMVSDSLTVRPVGGITVMEYAERFSVSERTAERELKRMLSLAKLRRDLVSIPIGASIRKIWVYSPVPGGSNGRN